MMKKKSPIGCCALAALLGGVLFAWWNFTLGSTTTLTTINAQKKTEVALSAVTATVDERLPAIVPTRYKETQERTVKTRETVHKEAETLSGDALSDALNRELALFDTDGGSK